MNPLNSAQKIHAVYYVESSGTARRPVDPIAIDPSIAGHRIQWNNTGRGAFRDFKNIKLLQGDTVPKTIEISIGENEVITFRLMTKDLFDQHLKDAFPDLNFDTDQEVQNFYLNTDF